MPSSSGFEPRPPRFSVFLLRRFTARGVFNVDDVERKKFRNESTRLTDFFVEFVGGGFEVGKVDKLFPPDPKWYFLDGDAILSLRAASESLNFSNLRLNFRPRVETPRTRDGLWLRGGVDSPLGLGSSPGLDKTESGTSVCRTNSGLDFGVTENSRIFFSLLFSGFLQNFIKTCHVNYILCFSPFCSIKQRS